MIFNFNNNFLNILILIIIIIKSKTIIFIIVIIKYINKLIYISTSIWIKSILFC